MSEIEDEPPPALLPCSICSRTFRPDVLDRHVKVCEKTASKKRRVFDSFKSRVSGTELEEFLGPAPLPGQAPKRPEKSPTKKSRGTSKWKETHENLIAVLRAARGVAPADSSAVLAPKNAGNEQCPSCGRFFGPRAFDRHVQFCKEKTSRIKLTPSKVSQAQERLEARTKYKAPLSLKPKLTTKEKYSPMLPRKVESSETCSVSSGAKSTSINSLNKLAKPQPGKNNISNFSRQSPTRSSERQRSTSPKKPLVSSSKVPKERQGKPVTQPKIKDNLKNTEDFRPRTGVKMSTNQDRVRNTNCKISDLEEQSPKLNRKCRESLNRKFRLSSDDGNETDSLNSVMGSNSSSVKENKKRRNLPASPGGRKEAKEKISSPKNFRYEGETKSSRRSKVRLPLINDLSVNDESFGIRVAPCLQHSPRKKSIAAQKISRSTLREKVARGEVVEKGKMMSEFVSHQIRSSKIPKPVLRDLESKKEKSFDDESLIDEGDLRKDRGKTAVIKKDNLKKWCDLSEVSTSDLLRMSEDFDFTSELDEQTKSELESQRIGDSEAEDLSRSTVWEVTTEEFSKSDEATECKRDFFDVPPNETNEDEFIVLHVAEPEKMNDDDTLMKMSVSEPCFKTNYPDPNSMLKVMKTSTNIFVFDSPPKLTRRKTLSRRASKISWSIKAKTAPKTLSIRERTFLANDCPVVKRRKISDKEVRSRPKMKNLTDYYFGSESKIRGELEKTEVGAFEEGKCENARAVATNEERRKSFDYFEIGKDLENCEAEIMETKVKDFGMEDERKNNANNKEIFVSVSQGKSSGKCTIYYSDEEFEELRQKKEKSLKDLNRKRYEKTDETLRSSPETHHEELQTPRSDCESKSIELSAIDSLEPVKISSLDNIAEEEEQLSSQKTSIEIEDFILKKPDKSSIMSKSGDCLEELFPKPPEMTELKGAESATAVPLSYVVDSLYDLKKGGKVRKKIGKEEIGLPPIEGAKKKTSKRRNSMPSLVQIWKTRKEMIENGSLFDAQMEKFKWKRQMNSNQIALLPLVLTQKLAEVAEQLDSSKSKEEKYDPFKQAERQMMALLSWPSTADLKPEKDDSFKSFLSNTSSNLETSPTSAFSKYNNAKEEQSPKEVKENVNQKKLQNSSARIGKRNSVEYSPLYSAADDWEEIFEKHFDLNRNEMNEKMTRSVKSALDGLLKNAQNNCSSSPEREISPTRKNRNDLSDSSVIEEIAYTSTPKRSGSRMSNLGEDRKSPFSPQRKTSCLEIVTPTDEFGDSIAREDRIGRKSNRNSGVSLSSLSFGSQASDTVLADEEIMRTNLEIIGVGKSTPRTTNKRRFARSQSVFDERNKMLFAKVMDSHFSSSDENDVLPTINDFSGRKTSTNNPYPKSVPSHFPRSQSVMDGRCKVDGGYFVQRDDISSPEGGKSRKAKMSGDSAYSSLNRRSPRSGLETNQQDRLSSSGSEHSLPPLEQDHPLKPVSLNFDNASSMKKDQPYKMSKFCHECGSKYPVAVAKFCCECGVRRLII